MRAPQQIDPLRVSWVGNRPLIQIPSSDAYAALLIFEEGVTLVPMHLPSAPTETDVANAVQATNRDHLLRRLAGGVGQQLLTKRGSRGVEVIASYVATAASSASCDPPPPGGSHE